MKKPQLITLLVGIILVGALYLYGRTVPKKDPSKIPQATADTHLTVTIDTILAQARKQIKPEQVDRLNALEHSVVRGDVKAQQLKVYHQLAHFWLDSARLFEPYAWYEAESARLENSEKSLTFAAHLFLENLRNEETPELRTWKAEQAKDLFERSLKLNPDNDSSQVGLGACYLLGNISATPMEGLRKVLAVADRDSNNVFAQDILGQGSMMSGQYDKAITRFERVYRLSANNIPMKVSACWRLAEAYESMGEKSSAATWYQQSLPLITNDEIKAEVIKRIDELRK